MCRRFQEIVTTFAKAVSYANHNRDTSKHNRDTSTEMYLSSNYVWENTYLHCYTIACMQLHGLTIM